MSTSLITRTSSGVFVETVKNAPLNNLEVDGNFITLAENKLERENNLSDIISALDARANLGVPDFQGAGAFGTWPISVAGNSGTATAFQNARTINGVSFDGTENIVVTAETDNTLFFGNGLNEGDFDGSSNVTVSVDGDVVVLRTTNQIINGTKTFNNAVEIETQATSPNHAVVGSRELTAGNGLTGGGDLTSDVSFEVDDSIVVVTSNVTQTVDGNKTFVNALNLGTQASATSHAVRADRSIDGGDGISGGGSLTADRTISVDSTVVRDFGDQTISGTKSFSVPPVMLAPGTSTDQTVRADRAINTGSGLSGGGDLTSNRNLSVDSTVLRTFGDQTIDGEKQFTEAVILNNQGSAALEALAAGRQVNSGDGLTGGGDLTTNRTLSVDGTVVRTSRNVASGDGLTGGGDLSVNRTLSVDSTVARTSRIINTGDGLSGGGDLTDDRTISVDGTVLRTDDVQEVTAQKTFSAPMFFINEVNLSGDTFFNGVTAFNETAEFNEPTTFNDTVTLSQQAFLGTQPVRADREINSGDGLSGGGDLTGNRELSVDGTVVRTTREIATGDGLIGGNTLSNDLNISVDSTVVRTTTEIVAGDGLSGGGTLEEQNIELNVDGVFSVEITGTQTLLSEDVINSANLNVGETIIGQTSGAEGVIVEVVIDSGEEESEIVARLVSGEFEKEGEFFTSQETNLTIQYNSASELEPININEYRLEGEAIDFIRSSNENIENPVDIPDALDKVLAIGGKLFDWNQEYVESKGGEDGLFVTQSDFGVVAEDVEEVFPQGVKRISNGELVVDYRKLFALSFAAIKELNDKIE